MGESANCRFAHSLFAIRHSLFNQPSLVIMNNGFISKLL